MLNYSKRFVWVWTEKEKGLSRFELDVRVFLNYFLLRLVYARCAPAVRMATVMDGATAKQHVGWRNGNTTAKESVTMTRHQRRRRQWTVRRWQQWQRWRWTTTTVMDSATATQRQEMAWQLLNYITSNRVSTQIQICECFGEFASRHFTTKFTRQFTNSPFASNLTQIWRLLTTRSLVQKITWVFPSIFQFR